MQDVAMAPRLQFFFCILAIGTRSSDKSRGKEGLCHIRLLTSTVRNTSGPLCMQDVAIAPRLQFFLCILAMGIRSSDKSSLCHGGRWKVLASLARALRGIFIHTVSHVVLCLHFRLTPRQSKSLSVSRSSHLLLERHASSAYSRQLHL